MENFFANLVKYQLPICLFFFLAIIGGVQALAHLPIDAFPDLANNQVQILTDAPGMAPLEAEQLVTIPIESIMNGLPGVVQVRSMSKFGLSVVSVVFQDNVDTYFARQLVFERLQSARSRLPRGIEPQLGPVATAMGEIYHYVVEGKSYSATDLKTLQDWDVKYQLRSVPGVAEVNTFGGTTQEYVVAISPVKMQQYGLTLHDVFESLERNNNNFGAGVIDHEAEQYTVRGVGRVRNISDIENIVVKSRNGAPIYLRNVANVGFGTALRQGAATKDGGGEVVTGIVMMLKGENSRDVIERVKERIEQIKKTLPEGVTLRPFYDQSVLVEQTIHTVSTNLIEGGTLVILVLLIMLGNLRAALIVAAAIPISMMFSFMGMKQMGITANIMSLGAVDFGMIVDGSIVMVENSLRRLAHNQDERISNLQIIQESVKEMARPILFGVLIITVVYMPILTLQGMEYKMFSPMVFTVCFALLGSLAIALTLTPVLCSLLLRGKVKEWESFVIKATKAPYLACLEWCLSHRFLTVAAAVAMLVATIASLPFLGTEFVPRLEEGNIIIETRNLPSISLPEALKVSTNIERAIKNVPEITTVVCRTGRPDLATDPMSVYQTDVYVMLKPREQWRAGLTKEKLVDQLRALLAEQVPGANFNFTQLIAMRVDELVSGVRSDVAVKIFGDDLAILSQKAAEVEKVLKTVRGQTDLQVEKLTGSGQLLITPDRERMARYGANVSDIQDVVQTAIMGTSVSEVLEGRKRFDLKVKFPEGSNIDPQAVQALLVQTADGKRVPLGQVASVELNEGVDVINREFAQRRIVVQCNVRDRDVGSFVQEAQAKLRSFTLPPGYYIQWSGQFENQERAMNKLAFVVPLSILIIFFLLTATFSSVRDALLVLLNVPFALIGGVIALWIRGMYLSVPASIGFIALFGVAVLNGLVLISYINKLMEDGMIPKAAIRQACEVRLRPVLMTAMVAALGFLPMAVSTGSGAEVQKPLATVVIGGIVTSTLLTLLVLPVLFSWLAKTPRSSNKVEQPI
ncbi:MAG TPA: CusA/CzcA family heavy metal efflux RND transporter [Trichormus sp.]|jgi:cobalt-zinc-cadmium resistance protein CzcA